MPYIKSEERRQNLRDRDYKPENSGELNFTITDLILEYWLDGTLPDQKQNYQRINDIVGALEGAKMEFYRRVAVPYEDKKIKENGDVYPE